MRRLLRALLARRSCRHRWQEQTRIDVYDVDLFGKRSEFPVKFRFVLKCKRCGDITTRNV